AKPQLQSQPLEGAARGETAPAAGVAADRLRDKKELDAANLATANKVAPAAAPVVPAAPAQAGASALAAEGRADEEKQRTPPQVDAVRPMREEVAHGALLKSAVEGPVVLAKGAGVTVRRVGTRIERSTDDGATWNVDLA